MIGWGSGFSVASVAVVVADLHSNVASDWNIFVLKKIFKNIYQKIFYTTMTRLTFSDLTHKEAFFLMLYFLFSEYLLLSEWTDRTDGWLLRWWGWWWCSWSCWVCRSDLIQSYTILLLSVPVSLLYPDCSLWPLAPLWSLLFWVWPHPSQWEPPQFLEKYIHV